MVDLSVDGIIRLYRTEGAARYGREAVSQEQHALQCGLLAQAAGADAMLVTAALLHDLGHLAGPSESMGKDDLHEHRALPLLRLAYPEAVLQPIRLHVAAKRYLCAIDPGYADTLSAASLRSLELQGGPFSEAECFRFVAQKHALEAVALRRWDDQAKSPTRATPGWEHFRPVLEQSRLPQPLPLRA